MNINTHTIWSDLQKIRQTVPLIHNITNYVVMNYTANALCALGATPIMAHAVDEVEDLVSISEALVINIGTLSEKWIEAMQKAMIKAQELNKPIIFDPVGTGATPYRTANTRNLLATTPPTVIRGNASEICAIVAENAKTKGVDTTQNSESAVGAAKELAQMYKCTVVISGVKDFIVKADQVIKIENGHPLMALVSGMGCTSTALTGAFLAVNAEDLMAAAHAMAVMGITGEIAGELAVGPGSFQMSFLDALYNLKEVDIESRLKLSLV